MATLSLAQLKGLAQQVGLSGNNVNIAAAIAMAESGGNTQAYNPETAAGTAQGHGSRGLWQIYGAAHPQYNNSSMFDALSNAKAMYAVSSGGRNWNPWSTYTSGAYRQYLNGASSTPSSSASTAKTANSNLYVNASTQCTWWAAQRYHDLTGFWVPWTGNANQWYGNARSWGWTQSTTPPAGIPSIIVLQAGVQGADPVYGHVAVVEKVNSNGSVQASNLNWGTTAAQRATKGRIWTFWPGNGVGFVYAGDGVGSTGSTNSPLSFLTSAAKTFSLAPNADVTTFLAAVDNYLEITNPFDVQGVQQDNIAGVSFTDPVAWLSGFGSNMFNDSMALVIRIILIMLGLYLLYRVIANFVDFKSVTNTAKGAGMKLAPLLAGAV